MTNPLCLLGIHSRVPDPWRGYPADARYVCRRCRSQWRRVILTQFGAAWWERLT